MARVAGAGLGRVRTQDGRRPGCDLARLGRDQGDGHPWRSLGARIDRREDLGLERATVDRVLVERRVVVSPAAQDHVHRPLPGVDLVSLVRGRDRPAVLAFLTPQRERALVVMLVSTDHEVDLIAIEERQPLLANAELAAVEWDRSRDRNLVHAYDDPVDAVVFARLRQRLLEPCLLRTTAVAADVRVATILIADVIVVDRHKERRANAERVPQTAKVRRGTTPWKIEIGLIGLERIRPGASVQALVLVVARSRHPGAKPRGACVVVEKAAPGLHAQVLPAGNVGVAEVAVQQMKQRAGGFDLRHDEAGIAGPWLGRRTAKRVRDALITEAGEPKARTARR